MLNRQATSTILIGLSLVAGTAAEETIKQVVRDTAWSAFEWGFTLGGGGVLGIAIGVIACCIKCCADASCGGCNCNCCSCCDRNDIEAARPLTAVTENAETEAPEENKTPGKNDTVVEDGEIELPEAGYQARPLTQSLSMN